jgi:hypothetical protein
MFCTLRACDRMNPWTQLFHDDSWLALLPGDLRTEVRWPEIESSCLAVSHFLQLYHFVEPMKWEGHYGFRISPAAAFSVRSRTENLQCLAPALNLLLVYHLWFSNSPSCLISVDMDSCRIVNYFENTRCGRMSFSDNLPSYREVEVYKTKKTKKKSLICTVQHWR